MWLHIVEEKSEGIVDYKFYNFNGKPLFLYLSQGLSNHKTAAINFLTMNWEKAKFHRLDYKEFDTLPERPVHFEEMVELSKKLSEGTHFLRTDFYEINSQIYFGELTFFPSSGFSSFYPDEWDETIGGWLELPEDGGTY